MKSPKQQLKDAMMRSSNYEGDSSPGGMKLAAGKGNPQYSAEFDLRIKKRVYEVQVAKQTGAFNATWSIDQHQFEMISNAYTTPLVFATTYPTFLKTIKFPFPIFGLTDKEGGYKNFLDKLSPESTSVVLLKTSIIGADDNTLQIPFNAPSTVGGGPLPFTWDLGPVISSINGEASRGDLVMTYLCSTNLSNGRVDWDTDSTNDIYSDTFYLVDVIISCDDLAYGSLLAALSSDNFRINQIRYTMDSTQLFQAREQIQILDLSLFGATVTNQFSPSSFITPDQFNKEIINIPLSLQFDKRNEIASTLAGAVEDIEWNVFVDSYNKFK